MDDAHTSTPAAELTQPMPLIDKMVNVFASPGELYDNVRQTPITHANWLIPTLILVVVGVLLALVVMSNPSLSDQMKRVASEQSEKQIEKMVREGRLTPEQAEQARAQAESFGSIGLTVSRIAGPAIGPFIALFAWGFVYWLLGKGVMKASTPYWKVVEIVGLAFFIAIVEAIVTTLLVFALDSVFASPSLALAISNFSVENKWHLLAAAINIFTLWNLAIISVGLSRLFQRDLPKVLVLVFAIWILWTLLLVFGLGSLRG